eukprot:scaffold21993_cov82-Cylindrotheca_fusiformis.AAC.1
MAELKKMLFESCAAFLFMHGSDQGRYGEYLDWLDSQYFLGEDYYPKSFVVACNALEKFQASSDHQDNHPRRGSNVTRNCRRCYCCGDTEHISRDSPEMRMV